MPVGGITWRHTFRALRHRNYRLFFWGQLVSLIGTWMQQTAMSWFVYQITNSKLLLGTVAAVGSAPMMLFSIWGGSLADLYPKRSATYGHLFTPRRLALGGVWLFSIALFAFSLSRNFYLALAFLLIAGFGMLLFFSTSNTVLQTIVPDEMRGRVMGVWSLVFGAMIPLGSLEAGAVAHWAGTPFALALGACICALAALVALVIMRRRDTQLALSRRTA